MTGEAADPRHTYALVVGIEQYAAGPGWNLDGPASDACRFADWLLARGVPPEQILLFLSPLEENRARLGPMGTSAPLATQANIHRAITETLWKAEGDLLFLFWGGHGLINAQESRRLFYADATETDKRNLDFQDLLMVLRSNYFRGWSRQIHIVDACATYAESMGWRISLPAAHLPRGQQMARREQFVLLAARAGEAATNLTAQKTGLFSQIVLEELASAPAALWPPDMLQLRGRLKDQFHALRAAGRASQTPTHFYTRDWEENEESLGATGLAEGGAPSKGLGLWNVPHRNLSFAGREGLLEQLRQELARRRCVALSGLAGVGKSHVAIEYAHRYERHYQTVLWAAAETESTLISSLAGVARRLNLPLKDARDEDEVAEAVKRWLHESAGWLLILDNGDDPATAGRCLPTGGQGQVLLTTRLAAVGATWHRIEIKTMSPQEGAQLLLRRAELLGGEAALESLPAEDHDAALAIAVDVGGLPLALAQAGAYMAQKQLGPTEYCHRYQQRGKELRERGELGDHPTVRTTFSLAFEVVAAESPAAGDLLCLCTFLAPDNIPEEIFTEGAPDLGETLGPAAADLLAWDDVIGATCRYSMLDREPRSRTLTIHRVVQDVLRDQVPDDPTRQRWVERTTRVVNRAFPTPDFPNWSACSRLLPHAQACAHWVQEWLLAFPEAGSLLHKAGNYLRDRAQYPAAELLYRQVRVIYERVLEPRHPHVASHLHDWAVLCFLKDDYAQAEPLFQQALAIREQALGLQHPDVAGSLDDLAVLYRCQDRHEEAEQLFRRALAIRESALGPEHPLVADTLNGIANLLDDQADYANAESLYRQALLIRERAFGPEHPEVATSLNNLAISCQNQGHCTEAESLYMRALAIREKALGPEHPQVAASLNNLANLYQQRERSREAEPLYQRALEIQENAYGPEHAEVGVTLNNLAAFYESLGEYEKAERMYRQALAKFEQRRGAKHRHVAWALGNLASLYVKQGRHADAEQLYERALAIHAQVRNPEHAELAMSLNALVELYAQQGRYHDAEPLLQKVLTIREKLLGPGHEETLETRERLAALQQALKSGES